MNKQQTQLIKGVAILLMLYLHLFNQQANLDLCHHLLYIGDTSVTEFLVKFTNPVAFFLILGGYGLYKVNEKGDRNRWSRILKLFLHYWVILLIFVTVGYFINPERYPGNISTVISNATGFHTTYNGEMWFLFPYVLLSACAPWIFKFYRHFKAWMIVGATLFIHLCTSFCISRYGATHLYSNFWIYNPLLVFHLLFSFSLGAMAARQNWFERIKTFLSGYKKGEYLAWLGICICLLITCLTKYNFFYAFGIITCLTIVPMPVWIKATLAKLGDQSMNMWMIHTWFCYYLFKDFIYSFSYPAMIFIVLTLISYISSLAVNAIAIPLERLLFSRRTAVSKMSQ